MSQGKIRVAVVGLGMGIRHLDCYHKNPFVEVTAVCDLNEEYASDVARRYGVSTVTSDYRSLLNSADLNAVSIAVPTYLHGQLTVDFLRHGKHVLVEKPMAHTLEAAVSMADAARQSGKVLMVHHNRRYDGVTQFIRKMLDDGAIGSPYFVRTGWRRTAASMVTPTVDREGYTFDRSWFTDKSKGGGVLLDLGTHMIDRTMYLLGFPDISRAMGVTYCELGRLHERRTGSSFDAEDLAAGMVEFTDGLTMQLEVSFGSYIAEDVIFADIYGTRGGISDRNGVLKLIEPYHDAEKVSVMQSIPEPRIATPVDDFVSAIIEGRSPVITVEESLSVMRVLDALRLSGLNGRTVQNAQYRTHRWRIRQMKRNQISLQTYTVRDALASHPSPVFEEIARIGYAGVELGHTFDIRPSGLRPLLDDLGLNCVSLYIPMSDLRSDVDRYVDACHAMGCRYLVMPWVDAEDRTSEGYVRLSRELAQAAGVLAVQGIALCYHNHAFEFERYDGRYGYDILLNPQTSGELNAELDVYWLTYGDVDPLAYIHTLAGRTPILHMKDMEDGPERSFTEVGEGIIDMCSIITAGDAAGVQWYSVEQDTCKRDPLESIRISYDNLVKLCED